LTRPRLAGFDLSTEDDDAEVSGFTRRQQGVQAVPVLPGSGCGPVGEDVLVIDFESAFLCQLTTRQNLILDALGPLILRRVSRVDGCLHRISLYSEGSSSPAAGRADRTRVYSLASSAAIRSSNGRIAGAV
jgi:hypothetical protein